VAALAVDSNPVNGRASTRVQLGSTIAFAVLLSGGLASGSALLRAGHACQQVVIASSQEKAATLTDFAAAYNATAQVDGRCVEVRVEEVFSGDAELALETRWAGQTLPRPDVWSPASQAWVELLAQNLPAGGAPLLPDSASYESLFQSPLVIGMPAPLAQALGYPTKSIGWADIFNLTKDPQFRLGKTNPTISTSGLHALIGTYYVACAGKLTTDCIASDRVSKFVAQIETSVVHYGQTATDFLTNLLYADTQGTALQYVSAIALEEKELADYNAGLVGGVKHAPPHIKLVAIYPKDGTPVADHPYVVLRWATKQAQDAAHDFETFLKRPEQHATIWADNFRDSNGNPDPSMMTSLFPSGNQPLLVRLEPPSGAVLRAMIKGWEQVRKPARVLILIDAAVDARALTAATNSLKAATSGFLPQDKVGIWTFPGSGGQPASHAVLREITQETVSLSSALANVQAVKGPSDLDVALHDAVTEMAASYDPKAIDAILVLELSPGIQTPTADMIRFLGTQGHPVRVFTIGPSSDRLKLIALATGGAFYEPGSASHFLNDAISNF
jgi:Ca-activated chloride channel family protein